MIIKKLEFEYVFCFGPKTTIEFPERFNSFIQGQWESQPSRSNWAGKTSLIKIIKLLLFGVVDDMSIEEIPNENFKKSAFIRGEFLLNDKPLIIERTFSKTSSTLDIIEPTGLNNMDKREKQKKLDALIGLSYEDFVSTNYFSQGDIHQFTKARSAEKYDLLEKWMETYDWKEFEDKSKAKLNESISLLGEYRQILSEKNNKEEELKSLIKKIKELEENLKEKNETKAEAEKKYQSLFHLASNDAQNKIEKELADVNSELFRLGDAENIIKNIGSMKANLETSEETIATIKKELEELPVIQSKIKKLELEWSKKDDELSEIIKKESSSKALLPKDISTCPIDKEKCPRSKSLLEYMENIKNNLKELGAKKTKLTEECDSIGFELSKNNMQADALKKRFDFKTKLESNIDLWKEKIKNEKVKIERVKELETRIEELQSKVGNKTNRIAFKKAEEEKANIEIECDDIKRELGGLATNKSFVEDYLKNVEKIEGEVEVHQKKASVFEFLKKMFSRSGIASWQLKNYIALIEEKTNFILSQLDTGLALKLNTERELKTKETTKDELYITVLNQGREHSFKQESGGVQILVALALRLSILNLRFNLTGKKIQMIFLDEIFGMLDKPNRNQVYHCLVKYVQEHMGFKQIFQISHIVNDGNINDSVITITKKNRYSQVSFEF